MNKWHRHNHHTNPGSNEADSSYDPIASPADPFQGTFAVLGSVSANTSGVAGIFVSEDIAVSAIGDTIGIYTSGVSHDSGNIMISSSEPIIFPDVSKPALYADGSIVVTNAISADSLWVTQLYSASSVVKVTDMEITELSGFKVVGTDFSIEVPITIDPETDQGVFLNGIPLSGTSWASFGGAIQTNGGLSVLGGTAVGPSPSADDQFTTKGYTDSTYLSLKLYHYDDETIEITSESEFGFDSATGTITSYSGTGADLVIPYEIGGVPVVAVADLAMINKNNIVNVIGPKSLKTLGTAAFTTCSLLESISLPAVETVDNSVFSGCSSLTEISIPSLVSAGDGFISSNLLLTEVYLPSLMSIGDDSFNLCPVLSAIYWGGSIPSVGMYLFINTLNVVNYVTDPTATGWGDLLGGQPVVREPLFGSTIYASGAISGSTIYASGAISGSNLSGINTGDQDLSGLVPYTGALSSVDLGTNSISANSHVINNSTTPITFEYDVHGYGGLYGLYGDISLGVSGDRTVYINSANGNNVDIGAPINLQAATIYGTLAVTSDLYSSGAQYESNTRVMSTYNVASTDRHIFCDTDGGAFELTLPVGVSGRILKIINTGSSGNDLTITPNGLELLTGVNASKLLGDTSVIDLVYESTDGWW